MHVISQSIDSQHGMQVISERLGGNDTVIGLDNFSESLGAFSCHRNFFCARPNPFHVHATEPTGPFSCPPDNFWTACVPNRIIPLVGITVILLILIITPVLVYYERRRVLTWMEARRRNGLSTSPANLAIEMQLIGARESSAVTLDMELYLEWRTELSRPV
ncbi:hypothetical protein DFH06DRAFT_1190590 [Mycena polygramma]|nr:hypothetical protein DFH06DRAFT_1190590 [Mycena polygramma]